MLVRDIMKSPVTVAQAGATLAATYLAMQERGIRHLPVVDGGRLVGVVTDRDLRLATSVLSPTPFSPEARVAEVMSHPVRTAHPLDLIEEAARTMRRLKIGCLPVLEGAELVGMVTGIDLLDALLRLTGVCKPSSRLEVVLVDRPGELARLAGALAEWKVNIHSILTYPGEGDRMHTVMRVGTIEVRATADRLRALGFEVAWPASKPW